MALVGTDLGKSYNKVEVVKGVSLCVEKAEVVGLLGPNGAGKTTSFYMMVGLVKANKGKIELEGRDITHLALHQRALLGIGYLPQEASVFRDLTVVENIKSVLELRGLQRIERRQRIENLLVDFGLTHIANSLGRELSGGERRRVEIARTLALDPDYILLDEPFAGVDPLAVGDIREIVNQLKQKNIGILITDHNVRETLGIVDRAYIMSKGELLVGGTVDELLASEVARKFYLGEDFRL